MQVKFALILLLNFSVVLLSSQSKNDYYYNQEEFVSGLYKTYDEFIYNKPSIQNELIKKSADLYFLDKTTNEEIFVDPNKVWGYAQKNNVYISYADNYWKLINTGKLNHFTAIVIHTYHTFDPYGFAQERVTKVLTHLFFDIDTGEIKTLNRKNLQFYLDKDSELKKYYRNLKGNKEEKLILTLRAFNERHPVNSLYEIDFYCCASA